MAHSITTLTASAETALVVNVATDGTWLDDGDGQRVWLPDRQSISFHWSSDLPIGPILAEPAQLLHVPGQLGSGNSYSITTDQRGYPATA